MNKIMLYEDFRKIATASISDAIQQITGERTYMNYQIKPRINDQKIVGPAVTVYEIPTQENVPPTHALEAIDTSPEGSIIVIGIEGSAPDVAVWGGIMTAGAVARKLAGAVLDAGVRDISEIKRDFSFPIFSRSISIGTTVGKYKTEAINIPIKCGDVTVYPGDLVVADEDGVVVVPQKHIKEVLTMAQEIELKEAEQTKYIRETKSIIKGIEKYNRI